MKKNRSLDSDFGFNFQFSFLLVYRPANKSSYLIGRLVRIKWDNADEVLQTWYYVTFMRFNLCQISDLLEVYKLGEILSFRRKLIKSHFNLLHITYVTLYFAVQNMYIMSSKHHFVKQNNTKLCPLEESEKEHFLRSRITEIEIRELMWKQWVTKL